MKKPVIVALVIIVILAAAAFVLVGNKKVASPSSSKQTNNTTHGQTSDQKVAATITYSDQGFSPSLTTVKVGDTVAIKNTSSNELQFDSDPHPVHTDDTDLNVGTIAAGQTKTFTVTKKGSFGFHNHLNPSDSANITIQ